MIDSAFLINIDLEQKCMFRMCDVSMPPQECNPHAELTHIGDVVNLGPEGDVANVGLLFHLPIEIRMLYSSICIFILNYHFIYLILQDIKEKR